MDFQDQNSPQTPVPMPTGPAVPQTSAPPVTPAPSPFPVATVPTYSAQHVQIDGDVAAVPQETVGLGADTTVPAAAPGIVPAPADRLSSPAEVFPEIPTSVPDVPPASEILQPALAPDPEGSEEPQPAVGEEQKTPLEILEEILASANEGPGEGAIAGLPGVPDAAAASEPGAEKPEDTAELARQAAAHAAEEERYQQEAEKRIALAQVDLEEAAQKRVDVTKELQEKGIQTGPTVSTQGEDQFEIQQLQHDTLSQKGE